MNLNYKIVAVYLSDKKFVVIESVILFIKYFNSSLPLIEKEVPVCPI